MFLKQSKRMCLKETHLSSDKYGTQQNVEAEPPKEVDSSGNSYASIHLIAVGN